MVAVAPIGDGVLRPRDAEGGEPIKVGGTLALTGPLAPTAIIHHTWGIPRQATYKRQFPSWHIGPEPERTFPDLV